VPYEIIFDPPARKDLKKIPRQDAARIMKKIRDLASDPRPPGSKKLKGYDGNVWRIRVGVYRVIYEIDDDGQIIIILVIQHRKDVYRP
jgi:mRNA interferase RelE/StbE